MELNTRERFVLWKLLEKTVRQLTKQVEKPIDEHGYVRSEDVDLREFDEKDLVSFKNFIGRLEVDREGAVE